MKKDPLVALLDGIIALFYLAIGLAVAVVVLLCVVVYQGCSRPSSVEAVEVEKR